MKSPLKIFTELTIYLMWFAAVFDPIGKFYAIRYVALFFAIILVVFNKQIICLYKNITSLRYATIVFISVVMPLYGIMLYLIRGGWDGVFVDTSYIAAGVILLASLIYSNRHLAQKGLVAMVYSLRLLLVVIILIFISELLNFNSDWLGFFTKYDQALIGIRNYGNFTLPYIYFLASPMLIFLIGYEFNQAKNNFNLVSVVFVIFSVLALVLSGTRAHIIIGILIVPILIFSYSSNKLFYSILLSFCIGITSVYFQEFIQLFFDSDEASNQIKIRMLADYTDIFNDPITLIFGQGYNGHVWSSTFENLLVVSGASKTELTYIELVRVYGAIFSFLLFLFFIKLIFMLKKLPIEYRWILVTFLLYLINAAINPYLFSTNGMLPLGLILSLVYYLPSRKIEQRVTGC
jgi:hypothetical protein